MKNHCCTMMSEFIIDERIPIKYFPKYREYNIVLSNSNAMQGINFCPWCGKQLPQNLRDAYYDLLEQDSISEDANLPSEFQTDEWWKKRDL